MFSVMLNSVVMVALCIGGYWLYQKIFTFGLKKLPKESRFVANWLKGLLNIFLFGFVAMTVLANMGVDITALLAGLSLGGFALSFAVKDMLSNLLAGVFVLITRPFKLGDWVEVDKAAGTVAKIELRYTTLQDDSIVRLVPNTLMLNKVIHVKPAAGGH